MSAVLRLVLLLQLFAPASVIAAPAPAPVPDAGEGPALEAYDLAGAKADVETISSDRGKAYLEARARLENNPKLAAAAVMARLEAVPAPGPETRDRLLNVLAALRQPEHVDLFGQQLREAMLHERDTDLWIQLLRRQGDAATGALIKLVGDKELSNMQRSELLALMLEVTSHERLGELMAMVGRGSAELQDTLRRGVIRRARAKSRDRAAIAAGIDEDLDEDAAPERVAQLLILRAACCDLDEDFVARLELLAADENTDFSVRVAAIDGLDRLDRGAQVLEAIARAGGAAALTGSQAQEILVALALDALPEAEAAAMVSELGLLEAEAPRLAQGAYRHANLASDHSWLAASQTHAWPVVRKQALTRVAQTSTCDKDTLRALASIAGPVSEGGDKDARVGRAAIGALGRCNDPAAYKLLRELLEDTGVDLTQRGAAARQLAAHDPQGADHVANLLLSNRYPDLARDLAVALGHAMQPNELVHDALCRVSQANPMVASTAHESLSKLFPGEACD